jgi:hypothetical protein
MIIRRSILLGRLVFFFLSTTKMTSEATSMSENEQTLAEVVTEVPQRKRIVQPRTPKQLEALEKARAAKRAKREAAKTERGKIEQPEAEPALEPEPESLRDDVVPEPEPESEPEPEQPEPEPETPPPKQLKRTKKMTSNISFVAR